MYATNFYFRNSVNPNFGFNRLSVGNPFYLISQNIYDMGPRYSTITYNTIKDQNFPQNFLKENNVGLRTNPKALPMTNSFNLNTQAMKSEQKYNPYYNPNNYPQRIDNVKDLMNYTYSKRVPKYLTKSVYPTAVNYSPVASKTTQYLPNQRSNTTNSKIPNSSRIPKINENIYNSLINNFIETENYNGGVINDNKLILNEQTTNDIKIENNKNEQITDNNPISNQYSKKTEQINNAFLSADIQMKNKKEELVKNNINTINKQNYPEIVSDNNLKEYFRECKGGIVKHYGYCEDNGQRDYMEDQGKAIENLNGDPNQILFGIFDGHGGGEVSKFLQDNIGPYMKKMLPFKDFPKDFSNLFSVLDDKINTLDVPEAGSTASVAYIEKLNGKRMLHCASVGDSRCVLVRKDKTLRLSHDDRVEDPKERERIIKNGGIIYNGRIIGQLMLSRCFGDWAIKEYGVIVNPHVANIELTDDDLFLVIASDGVWDVIKDEELKELTKTNTNTLEISKNIIVEALRRGSEDNISCFVIKI